LSVVLSVCLGSSASVPWHVGPFPRMTVVGASWHFTCDLAFAGTCTLYALPGVVAAASVNLHFAASFTSDPGAAALAATAMCASPSGRAKIVAILMLLVVDSDGLLPRLLQISCVFHGEEDRCFILGG